MLWAVAKRKRASWAAVPSWKSSGCGSPHWSSSLESRGHSTAEPIPKRDAGSGNHAEAWPLSRPQLPWQSSAAHTSAKTNSSGLSKELSGQSLVGWAEFLGPPEGTRTLLTAERGSVLIAVSEAQRLQEGILSGGNIRLVAGPEGQEYEEAW